jgi:hypothetical protein
MNSSRNSSKFARLIETDTDAWVLEEYKHVCVLRQ